MDKELIEKKMKWLDRFINICLFVAFIFYLFAIYGFIRQDIYVFVESIFFILLALGISMFTVLSMGILRVLIIVKEIKEKSEMNK